MLISFLLITVASAQDQAGSFTQQERLDRAVDVAAVASRETAISNLKRLLRLKRGTPQEAGLIWRLTDIEWKATRNHFRVGATNGENSSANLRYQELLKSVITHTTDLMARFPNFKDWDEALFRRGQAYQELEKKELAIADYIAYTEKYPRGRQHVTVRLLAADLYKQKSQFTEVLRILQPVDIEANHGGLEAQVVERQAFANFNLERFPEALRKTEWLFSYLRRPNVDVTKTTPKAEVIAMIALFYGTAYERGQVGYSLEHAFSYFRKLDQGRSVAELSKQFVLVLRSKDRHADVFAWKNLHLQKALKTEITLYVLIEAYDAVIAWKEYKEFKNIEKDFDLYFSANPKSILRAAQIDEFKKFKSTLLDFSEKLYQTLPKPNPSPAEHWQIANEFLTALSAYMRISDPKDLNKAKVRYRMGEFYVGLKDYEKAQMSFTEVFQTKEYIVMPPEFREQARTQAILARYDFFKEKGILPNDLKAQKLTSPKKVLEPQVAEWVRWVEEVAAQPQNLKNETFDKLLFEANRLTYAYGDVDLAYRKMLNYVGLRPNSKLTPATCALIIDTLILSEAWVATRTLSMRFQKMPNVSVGEFKTKLVKLELDSHFKITQTFFKLKDYKKAYLLGEEHLKTYSKSEHRVEVLTLLGRSAMELKSPKRALVYFEEVLKVNPNSDVAGVTYTLRAEEAERSFNFRTAFEDLLRVYELPQEKSGISPADVSNLKRKIFLLANLSGESKLLDRLRLHPKFCKNSEDPTIQWECERFEATQAFYSDDGHTAWQMIELSEKSRGPKKVLWLASAFSKGSQLPNSVLKKTTQDLLAGVSSLDPVSKMETLSHLIRAVPETFDRKMNAAEDNARIEKKFSKFKDSLEKRLKDVQGLEGVAGDFIQIPVPELRIKVLSRLRVAYESVAKEVGEVPTPKDFNEEEAQVFQQAITQITEPLKLKVDQLVQEEWALGKEYSLSVQKIPQALVDKFKIEKIPVAPKDFEIKQWVKALPSKAQDSTWSQLVLGEQIRPLVFMTQLSQTPEMDRFGLIEQEKWMLQIASLRKLGFEWDAIQLLRQVAPKLTAEAASLYPWLELGYTVSSFNVDRMVEVKRNVDKERSSARESIYSDWLEVVSKVDQVLTEEAQNRVPSQQDAKPVKKEGKKK